MSRHVNHLKHWIATIAEQLQGRPLTSIHHKLDRYLLGEAHASLKGNKASGIDAESKAEFGRNLTERADKIVSQIRTYSYRAPAVRRVDIPKGDGKTRPIGIPTHEDKVLQKAFVMLVEPVFEREFHPGSYGYRPGRNCHQAVQHVLRAMNQGHQWIIELDIQGFFDSIPHLPLREMFRHRVSDGVLNQLIIGWLKAGVMKEGQWQASEDGTPQGGIVSPLLANLYLHEVLDQWIEKEVRPRIESGLELIRYADDALLCFQSEADARRVLAVLPKRFSKYVLTLHPEKTKLVDFRAPWQRPDREAENYHFLGFTYYWGKSRQGSDIIKLKTERKRYNRGLKAITEVCRRQRHQPIGEQQAELRAKLRGHIGYYGVTHNYRALARYIKASVRIWCRWLNRRGSPRQLTLGRLYELIQERAWVKPRIEHNLYARAQPN